MKLLALLVAALNISFAAAPQRIISTAPSITETLFAMGLGPRVVGDTIYCKYPPAAIDLPKIGTYLDPDIEAIVALHPGLVVVQVQSNHLQEELTRLHIPNVGVQSHNLAEVYAGARAIGKAAGCPQAAEQLVTGMQTRLAAIHQQALNLPRPRALFLVGQNPGSLTGLFAGGRDSFFSDLLDIAGGANIFNDAATPFPEVSLEEILARNPDVILELSGEQTARQREILSLWQRERSLSAVIHHRVYPLPSTAFLIPGPRAPEAAAILLHLLHPELRP